MPLSRNRTRLLLRLRDRKGRPKEGRVLVEGPRAVATALDAGAAFDFVLVADTAPDSRRGASGSAGAVAALCDAIEGAGVEVLRLPPDELDALADTDSPQGLLAVVHEPEAILPPDHAPDRVLLLDGIQDPGNAGTLLRSAAAMGIELVIALDGTVDPWNPKTVRASAGEAFRISIVRTDWGTMESWRASMQLPLLVADGSGMDVRRFSPTLDRTRGRRSRWALLVGNEGSGPRAEATAAASAVIALPLTGRVDSLNAAMAGSILLWALGPGGDTDFHIPSGSSNPSA